MKYAPLIFALAVAQAQPAADFDQTIRDQVIRSALDTLNQGYVYPEIARTMSDVIAEHRQKGEYDLLSDPNGFALALTRDLQAVSHDRHLHIDYGTGDPVQPLEADPDFGFGRTARLPGNVGYIELRSFSAADGAAEKTASVMRSLNGSSALIIDLRRTRGGRPAAVRLIASYLFGPKRVHLYDLYDRPTDETTPVWTFSDLPAPRLARSSVYILTSRQCFSSPEALAYTLQSLKRATIVGEVTGGGAHPSEIRHIGANFNMLLPTGRFISPVTGTDWERVGVKPDVAAPAANALKTAHLLALKRLAGNTTDPDRKIRLQALIAGLESPPNPKSR